VIVRNVSIFSRPMSEALFRGDCFSRDRYNPKADAEGGMIAHLINRWKIGEDITK